MGKNYLDILKERLDEPNYKKLMAINNPYLHEFVAKYIELCNPDSIFVSDGSDEALQYIRGQQSKPVKRCHSQFRAIPCISMATTIRHVTANIPNSSYLRG